jgi:phosphate:Na+ symporter
LTGALAVMLGSNIGTTIPDALLGSIGLQYDIKMLTFPMLLLGAIGITFFSNKDKVVVVSKAIIALALTFLSFSLMKSGLMFLTTQVDLSMFMTMSPWIFFLVGLLLTLLVQSGGAVFIIALTSVSSGLITAEASLPIFFATYLGATITIVIASLGKQPAIKKQVAMGHVGFNLLVAGLGMLTLPWIKELLVTEGFPRWGDIRTLAIFYVAFRTMVGVLVFPFLGFFARVFQKYIIDDGLQFSLAIQKIQILPLDVELTLLAVKQDLLLYFKEVIGYNLNIRDFYLTDVSQSQENVENLFQREMNF